MRRGLSLRATQKAARLKSLKRCWCYKKNGTLCKKKKTERVSDPILSSQRKTDREIAERTNDNFGPLIITINDKIAPVRTTFSLGTHDTVIKHCDFTSCFFAMIYRKRKNKKISHIVTLLGYRTIFKKVDSVSSWRFKNKLPFLLFVWVVM